MNLRPSRLIPLLAVVGALAACSDSASTAPDSSVLPPRTVEAGAVKVTIVPTKLDASGATFAITLDTHSVDLSMDLAAAAVLDVGGVGWTVEGWTGAEPGGHHREGELRFTASGSVTGTARLTISGLPGPVEATWNVGAG